MCFLTRSRRWTGNFQVAVLATAEQTAGQFSLLQTRNEPPGFGPPLHLHRDAAEAFFVLEGEYLMFFEDRQQLCPAGSFVYVPPRIRTPSRSPRPWQERS